MTLLHPVLLDRSHLRRAWPLMQMASPGLSLDDWIRTGGRQIAGGRVPRRGLFALASEGGYFYGLAAFARVGRPPAPLALEVKIFSLAALSSTEMQVASFCGSMRQLARLLGCSLLRLMPDDLPSFVPPDALLRCGFTRGEVALEYALGPETCYNNEKETLP